MQLRQVRWFYFRRAKDGSLSPRCISFARKQPVTRFAVSFGSSNLPYGCHYLPLTVPLSRCRLDELHDRGEASVRLFDGLTDRSIFIGSLEAGVKSGVHSVYSTSKSKPVQFHVFETNNDTIDDYNIRDHTEKALVDIWLLSYAQTLIVTPTSTYGHVAMALGNTETWVLDREPLDGCSKARSLEPCLQVLPTVYRNELAGKAESSGRVGFQKSLFGVVSECNDQPGGLSFVTS